MDADFTFYFSIVTGIMLTISEILPYIKVIKSNGITELIVSNLLKKAKPFNDQLINQFIDSNVVIDSTDLDLDKSTQTI